MLWAVLGLGRSWNWSNHLPNIPLWLVNHGQESPLEIVDACWHHVTQGPSIWTCQMAPPQGQGLPFLSLIKKEKPSFSLISIVSLVASMNHLKTKGAFNVDDLDFCFTKTSLHTLTCCHQFPFNVIFYHESSLHQWRFICFTNHSLCNFPIYTSNFAI